MRNALWFTAGAAAGFVLAHVMNRDPRGHEVLAEIDARITEFTDRITDAYRDQRARLTDVVGDAAAAPAAAASAVID